MVVAGGRAGLLGGGRHGFSWGQQGGREYQVFADVVLRRIARANPQDWRDLRTVTTKDSYGSERTLLEINVDKYDHEVLDILAPNRPTF
jgi:hypothetical protein